MINQHFRTFLLGRKSIASLKTRNAVWAGRFLLLTRSVGSMLGAAYPPLLFLMSNLPSAQITSTFLTEGESAHREQTEHTNAIIYGMPPGWMRRNLRYAQAYSVLHTAAFHFNPQPAMFGMAAHRSRSASSHCLSYWMSQSRPSLSKED